ncbi:zinc finger protein, putative [Theileria annulata]|uniref:Zinc finger protein, putative n=1 Tax=Theileria annulata TaxID=5874 RepID=Q4UGI1_THEAN|nr:zinc finger protein, putative [Theileria annulata]CAI73808.1 zinc finger protein, putative [Theileria annulata]|eukprot:XP_954485.1 zinc finger protein, putative [Theileria annulata]
MTRDRGYYNPGNDSFGYNSRRNNDYWLGPSNSGNRNDSYGYKNQGQSRNFANSSKSRYGDQNKDSTPVICKHFALLDQCRFGNKCSFLHTVKRILYMQDVFKGGVYCSTLRMTADNAIEFFACGHGPTIKRFKFHSNNANEIQTTTYPNITIQMPPGQGNQNNTVRTRVKGPVTDQAIHSLLFMDDCLFAGLRTGHICVHHLPSGTFTMLEGHDSSVSSIIVIEGIVLSSCESGKINLWRFDSGAFTCINSLHTNSKINSLLEVICDVSTPTASQPRLLWAGGSVINIIDLASLTVVKSIQLPSNVVVKCFKRYGGHVIVGFSNGYLKVFTPLGDEVYMSSNDSGSITAMDGMQTSEGDLLLVGSRSGELTVVQLPSFNLQYLLMCHIDGHKKSGISKIAPIGAQHFLTTGYDGNVSFFMWNNPV